MPEEVQAWTSFSVPLTSERHLMLGPEFIYKGLAKVGLQQESCSCLQALQRSELQPSTSCSRSLLEITLSAHKTHILICFALFRFAFFVFLFFSCGFMEIYSSAYFHLHNCVYTLQKEFMMCYFVISKVISICLFKCSVQWFKPSG